MTAPRGTAPPPYRAVLRKRGFRPRQLAHRGTVQAAGYAFDTALIGEREARRRVLALWTAGAAVYTAPGGALVLTLPSTVMVIAETASGTPLVRATVPRPDAAKGYFTPEVLLSAPMTPADLEALAPEPGSVVLLQAGLPRVVPLTATHRIDPSVWLDLTGWEVLPAVTLGALPERPEAVIEEVQFDAREKLGGIPPASEEAQEFAAALRGERVRRKFGFWKGGAASLSGGEPAEGLRAAGKSVGEAVGRAAAAGAALLAATAKGVTSSLESLGSLFGSKGENTADKEGESEGPAAARTSADNENDSGMDGFTRAVLFVLDPFIVALGLLGGAIGRALSSLGASSGGRGSGGDTSAPMSSPTPASMPGSWSLRLFERLSATFNTWSSRMLFTTGLADILGRRQAAHLTRVMRMFQEGNLDEALRHAIPLGGPEGLEARITFGVPGARGNLNINPHHGPGSAMAAGGQQVFEQLRALYRSAFEKLVGEGRLEEAAFVLAELLHADVEAVQFLEQHGRLKLAAELAEARGLPSGLVVRQWWVAGERERAILFARRMGAFADAVIRLEKSNPDEAAKLRLLWADARAEAGDYLGAAEAIWPLSAARNLAVAWLDRGIAVGGVIAARLLLRKLELLPEAFTQIRAQVLEILDDPAPDLQSARRALAQMLPTIPTTPEVSALARPILRAITRDAAAGADPISDKEFRRLMELAGDSALRTDLPSLPRTKTRAWLDANEMRERFVPPGDTGTAPLTDAALLPDGRMLLALGEAGLRLVGRDGRTIVHWDQPAHGLVLSDRGDRAIFLAPRGESTRLGRVDLLSRKAAFWCDAPLTCWAPDYDGSMWFVASGRDLALIDATAKGWTSIWHRAGMGPSVQTIARSEATCWVLTVTIEQTDTWGNRVEPREKWEKWKFDLPGPVLQRQIAISDVKGGEAPRRFRRTLNEEGFCAEVTQEVPTTLEELSALSMDLFVDGWGVTRLLLRQGEPSALKYLRFVGDFCATLIHDPEQGGPVVFLAHRKMPLLRYGITLEGQSSPTVRLTRNHLIVTDDHGRLLALYLHTGRLIRDLRLNV